MIIWGGEGTLPLNSGGQYDPVADTWTSTATTGAPTARFGHSAVWTGSEMIVWGGANDVTRQTYNTGGRYNAVTDTWITTRVPSLSPRAHHAAIWDGARMIVWGADPNGLNIPGTGGRYDPVTDSWSLVSTANAPSNRSGMGAVWTGAQMLIWGGDNLNNGGRYFGDTAMLDLDGDGYSICGGDCNDENAAVHPGATEVCNGVDDNCDGTVDETGPGACADTNPCTVDSCGPNGECFHSPAPDGTTCSDDNSCTQSDTCQAGVCEGGSPVVCTAADACHLTGTCDPATGMCSNPLAPDGSPCSDGMDCTSGESCHAGICSGGQLNAPPTVSVALNPPILTPANHQLEDIHATVFARDACGNPLSPILVSVVSNEPDDAPGSTDGHTINDIQGASIGTMDFEFLLRAERDKSGSGRIYTATYTAMDSAGHTSQGSGIVTVPLKKNSPPPPSKTPNKQKETK
jgi:hypothetical protein